MKYKLPFLHVWVSGSRWPWQGYGWHGTSEKAVAPLSGGARFGAGWRWKLGIGIGGSTLVFYLLFGIITFITVDPATLAYNREKK